MAPQPPALSRVLERHADALLAEWLKLARLRGDPGTRAVPVVVWTGQALSPADRGRAAAAEAVLAKSSPAPVALLRIREVLGRAGAPAAPDGRIRRP